MVGRQVGRVGRLVGRQVRRMGGRAIREWACGMGRTSLVAVWASAAVACGGDAPEATRGAPEAAAPAETNAVLDAAWSPDGARIVVSWDRGEGPRLYGVLPGTREEPPAPSEGLPLTYGNETAATWSPDRLWIAYQGRAAGNTDIYRMRPDGSGSERLTDDLAEDTDPAWSPDGSRIAFISTRGGDGPRLHMMDADGGNVRRVMFRVGTAHKDPVWARDGRRLVVVATVDGADVLYIVDAETGNSGRLGTGAEPAWSPDGARVYYAERDSIFWRPPDGGFRRFVLADARSPEPAPDGHRLAFIRGGRAGSSLYLLDLDTTIEVPVTP